MGKIVNIEEAAKVSQKLRAEQKSIVLVGGCFDVLHIGHLEFLKGAKKLGDVLLVLLESDETIQKLKGSKRPINTQEDRAKMLEALEMVDFIVPLPPFSNKDYDSLTNSIKPAIIATTKGDTARHHKERQAREIGAEVVDVVEPVSNKSTTRVIKLLSEEPL